MRYLLLVDKLRDAYSPD